MKLLVEISRPLMKWKVNIINRLVFNLLWVTSFILLTLHPCADWRKMSAFNSTFFFSIPAEGRGLGRAFQNITMLPGCSGKFFVVFGGCLIYWWSNLSLLFSYKLINKSSSLVLYSSLVLGANLLRRLLPTDGPLKEYQ